ncbi:MAG: NUDIX domain-containing protein [Oscillospiraceae bacterium]|nr:NUDIX domain-containing protein [Oscillospiraceae bacterium]
MDISFKNENQKFNYRACAMIIDNNRILAMKDERSPYYYLPGGRIKMGETAEEAVIRECLEELDAEVKIIRPLWLNQAFFNEDVDNIDYHELCIYFLIDISKTDILSRGDKFFVYENKRKNSFEWLDFSKLKDEYFYPIFLKKDIYNLPDCFTIRTERE